MDQSQDRVQLLAEEAGANIRTENLFLTQANNSICLFFHDVVSINLYFDAKADF